MSETADLQKLRFQNPYALYRMARNARVLKDPTGSFWLITRYDDVDAILKDRRFGKKALPGTAQTPTLSRTCSS